jgi:hypothetical protein
LVTRHFASQAFFGLPAVADTQVSSAVPADNTSSQHRRATHRGTESIFSCGFPEFVLVLLKKLLADVGWKFILNQHIPLVTRCTTTSTLLCEVGPTWWLSGLMTRLPDDGYGYFRNGEAKADCQANPLSPRSEGLSDRVTSWLRGGDDCRTSVGGCVALARTSRVEAMPRMT